MKDRYVVDTNVLIAASAADPVTPKDIDATPEDPLLRQKIWQWLTEFESSDTHLVLDKQMKIFDEYENKLGFNDYGIQVIINKMSTGSIDNVDVAYDHDGHGILPNELIPIVHDLADRKMVAAALESLNLNGESGLAFAGDTDWHEWEIALIRAGITLEPIIEQWSRAKCAEKQKRKNNNRGHPKSNN